MHAIFKAETIQKEQRMVWAEIYAPNRPDSDGEFMSAETIRKMAHDFLRKGLTKSIDVQHNNQTVSNVEIVESWIAMKGDPHFIEGAWVGGCHIPDDDTWEKVQKGELNGFSLEAMVNHEDREVELELPEIISGRTTKADDQHDHQFYAKYSDEGVFLGGVTDIVNGHQHEIRAGTVTEAANGHTHRFSAVDELEIMEE